MAAGHLALLCLSLSLLITDVASQRRCTIPTWRSELGDDPIAENRGKVLLVALLRGYCSYCVTQAGRLETLKNNLTSQGFTDIAMIIINGGEPLSRENVHNLQSATNIPVLQDTEDHVMFQQIFHGNKDDFIVFDRCGQRVAYIPHPYSYLGNTLTDRVLRRVHDGRHNCYCRLDRRRNNRNNPHDVMYGDQPAETGYSISKNSQGLIGTRSRLRPPSEATLGGEVEGQGHGVKGGRNRGGHKWGGHKWGGHKRGRRNRRSYRNRNRNRMAA